MSTKIAVGAGSAVLTLMARPCHEAVTCFQWRPPSLLRNSFPWASSANTTLPSEALDSMGARLGSVGLGTSCARLALFTVATSAALDASTVTVSFAEPIGAAGGGGGAGFAIEKLAGG